MYTKKNYALSVIATFQNPTAVGFSKLQQYTLLQFELINKLESEAAIRAIFTGLGLFKIKAALKHGQFTPWLEKNISVGQAQCNFYMKLALAFLEETKVTKAELGSLTENFELTATDDYGKKFCQHVGKFIGQLSLNELLIKHGIKGVGLKSALEAAKADENLSPAEQIKRRREQVFGETAAHLFSLRKTLMNPECLQLLDPSVLVSIDNSLIELRAAIAVTRKSKS